MVVERTVSETWVMANGRGITLRVGMIADAMFQRHSPVEARQGTFSERHFSAATTRYFVLVVHIVLEWKGFSVGEVGERD
jgi:hypothetical protein